METIKIAILIILILALDFMACYMAQTSACKNALKRYRENPSERNKNKYTIEHGRIFDNRKNINKDMEEKQ